MSYAAVSLGLFILIFAYFTLNAPKSNPQNSQSITQLSQPQQPQGPTDFVDGYCQTISGSAPTFRAPADNILKVGDDDIDYSAGRIITDPSHCGGNRNQIGQMTTYRLIRKNVPMTVNEQKNDRGYLWDDSSCHFQSAQKLDIPVEGVDTSKFKVFYPQISGEISLGQMMHSRTRDVDSSYMYFIDYGLVFLLHLNPDGSFVELRGTTMGGDGENFYLADIYQDSESGRSDIPSEALACDTSIASTTTGAPTTTQGPQVIQPGQDISNTKDQLQLQYFVFGTVTTPQGTTSTQLVNGWGVHCKPAVYLYPPKKQLVNVKVYPSGFLTYVDPPYDPDKGWTVWAQPDGKLNVLSSQSSAISYDYLYFESKIRDQVIKKPTKGWVVKYEELENLYKDILPKLGLNEKQKNDFIEYWSKALSKKPAPYYFVGIIDQDNVNEIERLEITPKPDSINRVRVYFERLENFKQVEVPIIPTINEQRLTNNDFRVVEWGGMVKNDPNHPFTCSQ